MCGIAGYNASPAWVSKYMTEEKSFNVLEQCWLHNEHRGEDAAGYMRIDAVNNKPYVRKKGASATDLLKDQADKRILSPSLVFGAHTRHATIGDARDNVNNHPVEYGQLMVTHNGSISNHEEFKKLVPLIRRDKIGEVDSFAIPIALDTIKDPHDMNEILEVLPKLRGNLAIHAVWKNFPGVSLLARGTTSPLVVRWHPEGFFGYASEEDALHAMILETGMDPNDDEWQHHRFDEHAALIVEYGIPVLWGSYKKAGSIPGFNKLEYFVRRLFQGQQNVLVFEHDDKNAWDAHAAPTLLTENRRTNEVKLIFTSKKGFRSQNTKKELPLKSNTDPLAGLMEADRIYEHKKKPLLYAQYGDVEVIIGQHDGKIKDIYNHQKFQNITRRIISPKEPPAYEADESENFESWLLKSTTKIHSPIKERTEPKFTRKVATPVVRRLPLANNPTGAGVKILDNPQKAKTQPSSPATETKNGQGTCDTSEWPFNPDIITLDYSIGWKDLENYKMHPTSPMGFIEDLECTEHKEIRYSEHKKPEDCENAVLASIGFASCITDVSLWYTIDPSIEVVTRFKNDDVGDKISCYDADGQGCQFEPYLHRQIQIGFDSELIEQVMEILVGEICKYCEMKMFVRSLPKYMEAWTGDKKYVT